MDYSDLTIIMPTLNEEGNIGVLLKRLTRSYANVNVLVADDGSSDRTREIVRKFGSRNRRVRLLDRSNARRKGITVTDMDAAMHVRTPYLIRMDGDLQHPTEEIAPMYRLLKKNDVVVAVRARDRKGDFQRTALTFCANCLARAVFYVRGKPTVSDMMSGFIGIRTELMQELIRKHGDTFVWDGAKLVMDVFRLVDRRTRVAELPYSLGERHSGKSKFWGFKQMSRVAVSIFRT